VKDAVALVAVLMECLQFLELVLRSVEMLAREYLSLQKWVLTRVEAVMEYLLFLVQEDLVVELGK